MLTRESLQGDYSEIIGENPQIFEVLQQIENFAATSLGLLIFGETGTGKELVARALHKNSGRPGEMVSVNCAGIPESLLESELFGHEKGRLQVPRHSIRVSLKGQTTEHCSLMKSARCPF